MPLQRVYRKVDGFNRVLVLDDGRAFSRSHIMRTNFASTVQSVIAVAPDRPDLFEGTNLGYGLSPDDGRVTGLTMRSDLTCDLWLGGEEQTTIDAGELRALFED